MPRPILPRPIFIPIGPSIAYVPLTQGQHALIDAEDANKVSAFNWFAHKRRGNFYAATNVPSGEGQRTVSLHNMVTGFSFVDHHSRNTLDNRKINLRSATCAENNRNRKRMASKSPYKGIRPHGNKWVAMIYCGKPIYLGLHGTAEIAAIAYDKAAVKYHGEFASLNFPEGR